MVHPLGSCIVCGVNVNALGRTKVYKRTAKAYFNIEIESAEVLSEAQVLNLINSALRYKVEAYLGSLPELRLPVNIKVNWGEIKVDARS